MSESKFERREVSWKALDIPIFGTVTAPEDNGTHAAVVLVAGSGPTDRNWCSPLLPGSNGSGKLLAEELASRGYVTLRYDKMASGTHVKENLPKFTGKISMESHMEELSGAVNTLVSQKNVDRENMFVLTNSEGSIHAVNYQSDERNHVFKGLILTAPPGRPIGDVGRSQLLAQAKLIPNGDKIMQHYDSAVSQFLKGEPMIIDESVPEGLKRVLMALETPANLPFSRELWAYDLSSHIVGINQPILTLIGKKDIQVDWETDGKSLEGALSNNKDSMFIYPENANHVLKHEEMSRSNISAEYAGAHYNSPDAKLDEEALNSIVSWLDTHQ